MPLSAAEKRRIERHIANLDDPDQRISSRAELYLIRHYGTRAVDDLIEACKHPNPVVRFRSAWALGYSGDPRAYDAILRLTDDTDERVRYDATVSLGILGNERAIQPLVQMYLCNDDTRPAGMAFGRMGLDAVPALSEVLQRGGPEVRWSVVQNLGNFACDFADRTCIELLTRCTSDPDPSVRENAEFWLETIRSSASPKPRKASKTD